MNVQLLMLFLRILCGILVNDLGFRIFISLIIVRNIIVIDLDYECLWAELKDNFNRKYYGKKFKKSL